ncbi:hypothetical protein LB534_28995, partial [Mesorhizobium sp. CA18]
RESLLAGYPHGITDPILCKALTRGEGKGGAACSVQWRLQEVRTAQISFGWRSAGLVLHDERRTPNSERRKCPVSKRLFLRWRKRWKNAAMSR